MSIFLHEITKFLKFAGARGVTYMRLGISGVCRFFFFPFRMNLGLCDKITKPGNSWFQPPIKTWRERWVSLIFPLRIYT